MVQAKVTKLEVQYTWRKRYRRLVVPYYAGGPGQKDINSYEGP